MNNSDLMGIRAETLYRYDSRGRMVGSNESESAPAPRLFLGRADGVYTVRFGVTTPMEIVHEITSFLEGQPKSKHFRIPMGVLHSARRMLEQQAPVTRQTGGPAYRFPERLPVPEGAVEITGENLELLPEQYSWLSTALADWRPCFAFPVDGTAASVCITSRSGTAAAEAGVETLQEYRGRGFAGVVTATWAACIRQTGRTPFYSTWWENGDSQSVARKLGLIPVGTDACLF